ncbi:MAG: hypothetical protein EAZ42_00210 [Verrucomicrobia bacterium]|nr:MAG: hypothetical protein EAZ42_00210 [Verrucomicrobiota bacterium]
MIRKILLVIALLSPWIQARPWTEDVMYFMMTDRFFDGDPSNNIPAGSDPQLDDPEQKDIARYMGGDFRGVERALDSGYFNDLGVTALWLTPVLKNVWRSGYDLGGTKTGYHGYWTQDWLDIDPHLTSRTSFTGETYEDNAEGRMKHYQDLVRLAREKGIKIVQDVVLNHAGPIFYYDANSNNAFDIETKGEWIQPYKTNGFYDNAKWAEIAKWNFRRPQPDGPRELLGAKIPTTGVLSQLTSYGRKGFSDNSLGKRDGEEVMCDFFSLRDIWTDPQGEYFDQIVDEFVTIYDFYLTKVGVDALRIDTVKHVHQPFWDAFTERLRKRLGSAVAEKLLFGEIYDGDPNVLGRYTWRSDWPTSKEPSLDSVLDFQFCFSAREYLRHSGKKFGSPASTEKALLTRSAMGPNQRPFYNPNPGPDGLNAQQKMITFIENHDGLNRFRVAGVSESRNRLAQALLLTLPGIPCLYYGTEYSLLDDDGKIGEDGETGRMMFIKRQGGPTIEEIRRSQSYQDISHLTALRKALPALRDGAWLPLWVDSRGKTQDDGVFAFLRQAANGDVALVAMNASAQARELNFLKLPASVVSDQKKLQHALTVGNQAADTSRGEMIEMNGPLPITIPASSLSVYQTVRSVPQDQPAPR